VDDDNLYNQFLIRLVAAKERGIDKANAYLERFDLSEEEYAIACEVAEQAYAESENLFVFLMGPATRRLSHSAGMAAALVIANEVADEVDGIVGEQ